MLSTYRAELARFFVISQDRAERGLPYTMMPACPLDEVWHELLTRPDEYSAFSDAAVGNTLEHLPMKGAGVLDWVADYEARYGKVPAVYFATPTGQINDAAYEEYLSTGVIRCAWDCTPYGHKVPTPVQKPSPEIKTA